MKYKGGRAVAERLGLRNSTLEEDNMIKKIFQGLAFFGFLSVAFFILFLFNNKENTTFGSFKRFSNPSDTLPPVLDASDGKTPTPPTTIPALERCPETPPDLVGPLLVEFDSKRTLDEVKEKFGSPLQEGGRYKPPDCTAQQKVAIIIAFRNRHEHLIHWLYYLHPILMRQQLDYTVYVINQDGEGVFNRAKLMNAGYVEAMKEYDYDCFVFSDIDLVPMDDRNLYRCFDNPRHLAVAMDKFNFHLPYNSYFGGVSALSKSQYLKINGFPNTFWGWGGEDDDIYGRIIFRKMSISRPDSVIGKYRMIKHSRDLHNEPNPENPGKLHHTKHTMEKDGLNSLNYTVKEIKKDVLYTFINVDIEAPIK